MVLETYGPAAVLVNRKLECLYFQGPIDRYLKVASGRPAHDLIAMAREGVRAKLRSAVQRALRDNARVVMPGGRTNGEAGASSFRIVVEPAPSEREDLLLVCFVEAPAPEVAVGGSMPPADVPRVVELERELEATKIELQSAIRNLETSSEEQMAINDEALSVNEEYQSTNEELLASKEELQSLNEELNALNSQLQETLDRQRTTSDDLQNVLYSTDVATIFLDTRFNIRFFTPATKALFNVIPSDVGRPLTDLKSLAADEALLDDARKVLKSQTPVEREIQGQSGYWFIRRILPYRTSDEKTEGVVITFEDVTERRRTADALTAAKRQAELATIAKSRFLAAASHDLRQPLQTLALLQGLLAKKVVGEKKQRLVDRIDEALSAMTGMLNTLLDINQIEVGAVKAEIGRHLGERAVRPPQGRVDLPRAGGGPRLARIALRSIHSQRSASARADDPQPAFERPEIHPARQSAGRVPSPRGKAAHRDLGHRNRHPHVGAADDLRGIPSVGQRRPPAQPWPGAGTVDRQEPGRTAWPSHPGALAARKGLGVLD